ncbi:MAG: beta-Ala-His dipeptidase [Spirochaetales bacterium]|nr:beta-Ala-His dipeptidase [Spirochaetales bacterium]
MTDPTERILALFEEISRVPRQSGNREPMRRWLTDWADRQGFSWKADGLDNIIIQVPPSKGGEGKPLVVLQGHSDMVCEKTSDSDHDFSKDPLQLYRDGEWLRAKDTTLGADNGIALAIALDLATNGESIHPPLEILITSDEEIGLDGANALEPGFLRGRILINIDSEDEGVLTIGCAGGMDCLFDLPVERESVQGTLYEVTLSGLVGGHSGMEINKGRGSALVLMGRVLAGLHSSGVRIVDLASGSGATNAIAREAVAQIVLPVGLSLSIAEELAKWEIIFRNELGNADPQVALTALAQEEGDHSCLTATSAGILTDLIAAVPHGVLALSREIDDLVETSANLAAVKAIEEGFRFFTSQRSSVMSQLGEINRKTEAAARLARCVNVSTKNKYPAWQPKWDSPLLAQTKEVYHRLYGKDPVVEVIHAGLETGVIGSKYSGMDMISLGPTIRNPHSPDEALLIPTVKEVYNLISELLKSL